MTTIIQIARTTEIIMTATIQIARTTENTTENTTQQQLQTSFNGILEQQQRVKQIQRWQTAKRW